MIRYRADCGAWTVVAVECERVGWPHKDADGYTQFDNVTFDTEKAAWRMLLGEVRARFSLAAKEVTTAKQRLAQAEKEQLDAAESLHLVEASVRDRYGRDALDPKFAQQPTTEEG